MWKITNLYAIVAIVTIGGLLQGFDISSLSAILGTKAFNKHYGKADSSTQGGITASISGGSFMGCHGAFLLIDRIGRRAVLQLGCVIFIVGAILCTASVDIAMLIVGRFVCGFAVGESCSIEPHARLAYRRHPGMFTSAGPTYLAEISPRQIRGRILCFQQWSITWGVSPSWTRPSPSRSQEL